MLPREAAARASADPPDVAEDGPTAEGGHRVMDLPQGRTTERPARTRPARLERVESGIPRLDYILKGGFLEGRDLQHPRAAGQRQDHPGQPVLLQPRRQDRRPVRLHVAAGRVARQDAPAPRPRSSSSGPRLIPERIYYISGYAALEPAGPTGLLELIRGTLKDRQATPLRRRRHGEPPPVHRGRAGGSRSSSTSCRPSRR